MLPTPATTRESMMKALMTRAARARAAPERIRR
jgi:hypothetical protein